MKIRFYSFVVFFILICTLIGCDKETTQKAKAITVSPKPIVTARPTAKPRAKRKKPTFKKIRACRWNARTQEKLAKICKKYHISFEMCIAQAFQESRWNAKAIGDGGLAYGAWQIHPSTWADELKRWGYSWNDMYNLYDACEVYCKIMRAHFKRYDNMYFALMAWRWGGSDGFAKLKAYGPDTYALQVSSRARRYEKGGK